jgi:hypothetical protein
MAEKEEHKQKHIFLFFYLISAILDIQLIIDGR